MSIIVTGAAGFIGSAVVWALNKAGRKDIIAVDHLGSSEKWRNLRTLRFTDYFEKDEFRRDISDGVVNYPVEAVIHLGACSATTELDASYLADNNFAYTKEMAKFALAHGARFLYASSAATYGDGAQGYRDDETALRSLRPLNMYGYSKQVFDLWAQERGILDRIVGMKFTNVFGPNEGHKGGMRSVVHRAYEQIRDTGKVQLFKSYKEEYKDGEQMRDFLYVKDAVSMILFLLEHKNVNGIFNVGSGRAETWNSLAKAVFKALGKPPKIEYIEMPEGLKGRYQYYTKAEMGKLFSKGYAKEASPLEETVADYVLNYLVPERHLGDEA